MSVAGGRWHCPANPVNNNNNNNKTIQPDWLKTTLTEVTDVVNISEKGLQKFKPLVLSCVFGDDIWSVFFSDNFPPRLAGGQQWLKGRWMTASWHEKVCVFCRRSRGWFKKESSQVFTFNMIGASCATLHSNQETLWHFNSQGNEWKSTPVKKKKIFLFISDDINPIQSTIKLIECVTLCYSCPIKATWIHKALLQQIRVISFFYLTYVMTYKI